MAALFLACPVPQELELGVDRGLGSLREGAKWGAGVWVLVFPGEERDTAWGRHNNVPLPKMSPS